MTERGGISIGAGFSAEGSHQTTIMSLMSYKLSQERLNAFARASTLYDLVGPVISVGGDGRVVARVGETTFPKLMRLTPQIPVDWAEQRKLLGLIGVGHPIPC